MMNPGTDLQPDCGPTAAKALGPRHAGALGPLVLFALVASGESGCARTTEIVVRLATPGVAPATVLVQLERSAPFTDTPRSLPSFVVAALDGAGLDLLVTPQGAETALSLLPGGGGDDLTVAVSAPRWQVSPAGPQAIRFEGGQSKQLRFLLERAAPDLAAPPDLRPAQGDGSAADLGPPRG